MKETILTCDRCKRVVDSLTEVGAGVRNTTYSSYTRGNYIYTVYQHYAEWCDACCIEWGILKPDGKVLNAIRSPEPTLEDFLREIVREEIELRKE